MERIAYKITNESVEIHIIANQDFAYIYTASVAIWTLLGVICIYLLTIIVNSYIVTPIVFIMWLVIFGSLLFLASWHLSGVEIIKLTRDSLDISRMINNLSYSKSYDTSKISNFIIPSINDKVFFNTFKISTCNRSIYPGNVAFEYETNTYSFAFQIPHEDAVEIINQLNDFKNKNT